MPHKNDLDLGNDLALRFAEERLPQRLAIIVGFFRHRGAYARFKDAVPPACGDIRVFCDVTETQVQVLAINHQSRSAGAARGARDTKSGQRRGRWPWPK